MLKDFQWLALYFVLPCLLVFSAMFLNGLYQPRLQWELKLLESKGDFSKLDIIEPLTTPLFRQPSIGIYSKEGNRCVSFDVDLIYTQNKLFQDKLTIEKWTKANNEFASFVTFWVVLHVLVNGLYMLKQKLSWIEFFVAVVLGTICIVVLLTLLAPSHIVGVLSLCLAQIKIEAELMTISRNDTFYYAFIGVVLNILALGIIVRHYWLKIFARSQAEQ